MGAAAGGFTSVLLAHGAHRVYAVDAGHGQLLGSLRQDPRVVNLEATNVSALTRTLIPEEVGVVVIDVSYLSLGSAVAQLAGLQFERHCDLIGLVKPMFELRLASAPVDQESVGEAAEQAAASITASGWEVQRWIPSPVTGARGAVEALLHACLPSPNP